MGFRGSSLTPPRLRTLARTVPIRFCWLVTLLKYFITARAHVSRGARWNTALFARAVIRWYKRSPARTPPAPSERETPLPRAAPIPSGRRPTRVGQLPRTRATLRDRMAVHFGLHRAAAGKGRARLD